MPRYPSHVFEVEIFLKVCSCSFLYSYYISTNLDSHKGIQKYTATIRLDTSPVAFNPKKIIHKIYQFSPLDRFLPSSHQPPSRTQTRTDLIPELDLSIPSAGDDLGCFVWMPQGADAHLIVSLDPVVKLGGLPIPNIQLSICIS